MTLTPASDKEIKRIIINMERWRWLPEDPGSVYVWNNSPEFMLYVVKDGKTICRQDSGRHEQICDACVRRRHDEHHLQSGLDSARDGARRESAAAAPRWQLLDPQGAQIVGELQRQACRP